jgi:hypothetical protein
MEEAFLSPKMESEHTALADDTEILTDFSHISHIFGCFCPLIVTGSDFFLFIELFILFIPRFY